MDKSAQTRLAERRHTPITMKQLGLKSAEFFRQLQDDVSRQVEAMEPKARFRRDDWKHAEMGGGITHVLGQGEVFEKAGVNYSLIESPVTDTLASKMGIQPQRISATGISLVFHPLNPMVPTVHLNLRYLELENGDAWYGGGTDLTPWYLFEDDAQAFHRALKDACDRHDPAFYARFKKWCDEYFFIRHRGEARGIGGIFFDYQRDNMPKMFDFVQDIGKAFQEAYFPLVDGRKNEAWGTREKNWQLIRRGRYVEFNLVYDRGTLFGLETRGRTESILMSLPPEVRWMYDFQPEPGSRESALIDVLKNPRDWI